MQIQNIIEKLEDFAPIPLQESYDNCGLMAGDSQADASGALLCLEVTDNVLNEAIEKKLNLIIAHHPLIFGGIKSLTPDTETGRLLIKALKNNIAIYAIHTNIDKVKNGVSFKMAEKLGLEKTEILSPEKGTLRKLVTFSPPKYAEKVKEAIFKAGAGHIGEYSECSYNLSGLGTFKASENTNPFSGEKNKRQEDAEIRIETIFPFYKKSGILKALKKAHPYEEVAYDIYPLENENQTVGLGAIGSFSSSKNTDDFLNLVKKSFKCGCIRYTDSGKKKIKKVAVCGGSGASLFSKAKALGADAYISADFKYHDFFEGLTDTIIIDIGHYESEQFTVEIFHSIISQNFPNFAVQISDLSTNPINYL
ncbi:MAG: Nif3-like dinuclear metal center hexameric protein [Chitinophagaceae bacterium]|nr:MAG: Nif3-like dinuclear metal center hexameric protein [Chitinophagaceae bacterium]